jgi:hypothetical protein
MRGGSLTPQPRGAEKMKCCIIVFAVLVVARPLQGDIVQWRVEDGGNGHWYEAVLANVTWGEARIAAESRSHVGLAGYLVTLHSMAENDFVFSLVDSPGFWPLSPGGVVSIGPLIGGFQPDNSSEPDGNWQWVTGEPFTYTNWYPDPPGQEPNDGGPGPGHEDILHLIGVPYPKRSPYWNDGQDTYTHAGYVVEYGAPIPEPSTFVMLASLLAMGFVGLLSRTCRRR